MPRKEYSPWERDKQWQSRIVSEAFWSKWPDGAQRTEIWTAGLIPIRFGTPNLPTPRPVTSQVSRPVTAQEIPWSPATPRPMTGRSCCSTPRPCTSQTVASNRTPLSASQVAGALLMDGGKPRERTGSELSGSGLLKAQLDEERQRRLQIEERTNRLKEQLQREVAPLPRAVTPVVAMKTSSPPSVTNRLF
ncbi:unnamed protein product [Polarella glacialis]|uniref:Uncharacterized protein n=1 Tax=Polarella glacialis TaxID=89957 RepID=A0A813EWC7_POLGL|nr:unnamed protein product [Polarella glacialis]